MRLQIIISFALRCSPGRRIQLLLKLPSVEPLQEEPYAHQRKKASNLCQSHNDGGGVPGSHKDRGRDLEHDLDIVARIIRNLLVVP
jgi:hypothetical protein